MVAAESTTHVELSSAGLSMEVRVGVTAGLRMGEGKEWTSGRDEGRYGKEKKEDGGENEDEATRMTAER